jgi:ABC-2 type transport system ATP-binding protein
MSIDKGYRMIEIDQLTKRYPPQRSLTSRAGESQLAVDSVSFSVGEGEIFGLIGANGAGKTTLIRMLSTMVLPTSGRAIVGGYDVARDECAVRDIVGVVSSNERSFYWRLSGRENLRFFTALYQIPESEAWPWREELLEILGLGEVADQRFDHYSTGQKQRMAIARGLLTRPKILLMDEPTKGVDPIGAAEIVRLIHGRILSLWRPTILVTSHNLGEIERLCGRVALMHRGRLAALGTIDELRSQITQIDSFVIHVRGADRKSVLGMAERCEAVSADASMQSEGLVELRVDFARGSDGFAMLLRALIESGADVVDCSHEEDSFEQIFQAVIDAKEHTRKFAGGGLA